ncbi:DUF4168 domain-containing protein [Halofilum ochraceum]|uniref:DUF4168 domain-containing protein n=1 Tax=Halofilum ochraceum TaxID=1611323 RepID=UPI0009F522E6|nr:DUF4168 domain-containing protein [Halofilum ochraceum]
MGSRRRNCSRRVTNTLVAGALVLGGSGAIAASPERLYQDEIADEASPVEVDELTDDDLHGFIEAAHEIQSIRAEYAGKISEAEPDKRAALQAEAAEKMAAAVEDQGLELSQYREIGYLLENDADLPARLDRVAADPG